MEANQANQTCRLQRLNNWRAKVKTFASSIFSAPYLPSRFITVFLITNLTQIAFLFMNQPLNYWTGNASATGVVYTGFPIKTTPLEWGIFGTSYLVIALF